MSEKKPRTKLKRHPLGVEFTYDAGVDAAYIYLDGPIPRAGVGRTLTVAGNRDIYLDVDKDGRLLGIEIIDSRHLPRSIAAKVLPRRQ